MDKKAVALWMSWVLLTAFMVFLSAFIYNWIYAYAETSGERLEVRYNEESCDRIAIDTEACQKAEDLNIIIHNNGNLGIDKIIFRLYDLYGNIETKEKDIRIKAGKDKEITLLKQGTIKRIEAIPIILTGDQEIICRDKMQTNLNIRFC